VRPKPQICIYIYVFIYVNKYIYIYMYIYVPKIIEEAETYFSTEWGETGEA